MKYYDIKNSDLKISAIAYGCMNLGKWNKSDIVEEELNQAREIIMTAYEQGVNFFDHADIYTFGKSETIFGKILAQDKSFRDKIIIQTKCVIRFENEPNPGEPHRFDFSRTHIINSVNESLRRLQTDYIDVLLLHRPDALVEPEELAITFAELHSSGKVRYFGVSNHTAMQIELLRKYIDYPIIFNQVELSLLHNQLIYEGIQFNQNVSVNMLTHGTLDYCRLNDIYIQAWSPLAKGKLFSKSLDLTGTEREASELIEDMAVSKHTSPEGLMLAWLLRHPAKIQPIIGTTRIKRIIDCLKADKVSLSRDDWYFLLNTVKGHNLP